MSPQLNVMKRGRRVVSICSPLGDIEHGGVDIPIALQEHFLFDIVIGDANKNRVGRR